MLHATACSGTLLMEMKLPFVCALAGLAVILPAISLNAATSAAGDPIAADEQVLAAELKGLQDPSNSVREKAAARIRAIVAKYPSGTVNIRERDGGESRWKEKVAQLRIGMTNPEFEAVLGNLEMVGGGGSGGSSTRVLRLDDTWTLQVSFARGSGTPATLRNIVGPTKAVRPVSLEAEPGFTGTWVVWWANGQKLWESEVRAGKYVGDSRSYDPNGKFVSSGPR